MLWSAAFLSNIPWSLVIYSLPLATGDGVGRLVDALVSAARQYQLNECSPRALPDAFYSRCAAVALGHAGSLRDVQASSVCGVHLFSGMVTRLVSRSVTVCSLLAACFVEAQLDRLAAERWHQ